MAPINETVPFDTTPSQLFFHGVSLHKVFIIPLSIFGALSFLILIVLAIWLFLFRRTDRKANRPRRIFKAFRVGKMRKRDKRIRIKEKIKRKMDKERRAPPSLKFGHRKLSGVSHGAHRTRTGLPAKTDTFTPVLSAMSPNTFVVAIPIDAIRRLSKQIRFGSTHIFDDHDVRGSRGVPQPTPPGINEPRCGVSTGEFSAASNMTTNKGVNDGLKVSADRLSNARPTKEALDILEKQPIHSSNIEQSAVFTPFVVAATQDLPTTTTEASPLKRMSKSKKGRYSVGHLGFTPGTHREEVEIIIDDTNEDADISFETDATIDEEEELPIEEYKDITYRCKRSSETSSIVTDNDNIKTSNTSTETVTATADNLFNEPSDKEVQQITAFADATYGTSDTSHELETFNDAAFEKARQLLLLGEKIWASCQNLTSDKDGDDLHSGDEKLTPSASVKSTSSNSGIPEIVITRAERMIHDSLDSGLDSDALSLSRMDKAKTFLPVGPIAYTKKERKRLTTLGSENTRTPSPLSAPAKFATKIVSRVRSSTISVTSAPAAVSVSVDETTLSRKASILGNKPTDLEAGITTSHNTYTSSANTPNSKRFSPPSVNKENVYTSWDIEANAGINVNSNIKDEDPNKGPVEGSSKRRSILSASREVLGNLATNVNLARAMSLRRSERGMRDLMVDDLESGMKGGVDMW